MHISYPVNFPPSFPDIAKVSINRELEISGDVEGVREKGRLKELEAPFCN